MVCKRYESQNAVNTKNKNSQGYIIGQPPLGYMYDEMDKKRWVVAEDGAQIVRYIFELRKQGESMNKIAKILKKQKIYIPSVYAAKKAIENHQLKIREMNIFGQLKWSGKF